MKTVYLATLENSSQASMVQSALMNEGIESFLKNDILSSVINTPGFQIEIEVMDRDYDKAISVLKKGFPYLVDNSL